MTYQKLIKNEEREGFVKKKKLQNILKPSPRNYLKIGRGKIPWIVPKLKFVREWYFNYENTAYNYRHDKLFFHVYLTLIFLFELTKKRSSKYQHRIQYWNFSTLITFIRFTFILFIVSIFISSKFPPTLFPFISSLEETEWNFETMYLQIEFN